MAREPDVYVPPPEPDLDQLMAEAGMQLDPAASPEPAPAPAPPSDPPPAPEPAPADAPAPEPTPEPPAWEPAWTSFDDIKPEDAPPQVRAAFGRMKQLADERVSAVRAELEPERAALEEGRKAFTDLIGRLDAAEGGAQGRFALLQREVEGANVALDQAAKENSALASKVFRLENQELLKRFPPEAMQDLAAAFGAPNFWDRFEGEDAVAKMNDAARMVAYRRGIPLQAPAPAPTPAAAPAAAPANPAAKKQALVAGRTSPQGGRVEPSNASADEILDAALAKVYGPDAQR